MIFNNKEGDFFLNLDSSLARDSIAKATGIRILAYTEPKHANVEIDGAQLLRFLYKTMKEDGSLASIVGAERAKELGND